MSIRMLPCYIMLKLNAQYVQWFVSTFGQNVVIAITGATVSEVKCLYF